jgi:hypothetical protein
LRASVVIRPVLGTIASVLTGFRRTSTAGKASRLRLARAGFTPCPRTPSSWTSCDDSSAELAGSKDDAEALGPTGSMYQNCERASHSCAPPYNTHTDPENSHVNSNFTRWTSVARVPKSLT